MTIPKMCALILTNLDVEGLEMVIIDGRVDVAFPAEIVEGVIHLLLAHFAIQLLCNLKHIRHSIRNVFKVHHFMLTHLIALEALIARAGANHFVDKILLRVAERLSTSSSSATATHRVATHGTCYVCNQHHVSEQ